MRIFSDSRKSRIYKDRDSFSIFGIGDYSFIAHKIVVSGLSKRVRFVALGPCEGKPVLCDDTCYILPVPSPDIAFALARLLNHSITTKFIDSIMFPDAKRPVTKALLSRINLRALLDRIDPTELDCDLSGLIRLLRPINVPLIPESEILA